MGGLANGGYGNRAFVDANGKPVGPFLQTAGPFGFEEAMQHEPNTVVLIKYANTTCQGLNPSIKIHINNLI